MQGNLKCPDLGDAHVHDFGSELRVVVQLSDLLEGVGFVEDYPRDGRSVAVQYEIPAREKKGAFIFLNLLYSPTKGI